MTEVLVMVLVVVLGLAIGRIPFFGIRFGFAGVLLVGIVFGHFGFEIEKIVTDFGLLLFVAGVGLSAGPIFIQNFKTKATSYIVIAIATILFSTVATYVAYHFTDLPVPLTVGVMTGALTSTPGLGAAIEATRSNLTSIGYGIAYPFGVIGVILFVQLTIRITKVDAKDEARDFVAHLKRTLVERPQRDNLLTFDKNGFFAYFLAMTLGVLLGRIAVPLPGGAEVSLGNAGGALLSGLMLGYLGSIGPINVKVDPKHANLLSDLGLLLFYIGTGVNAGSGALDVLLEYGLSLFLIGAFITTFASIAAFIVGRYFFNLNVIDTLGAVTGAMTATPGLGSLIDATENPGVAASYASTYPIALLGVVLSSQVLSVLQ